MKQIYISFCLCTALFSNLQASDVVLDEVVVLGASSQDDPKNKKVGETTIQAKEISKQQMSDSRDLVRYQTGVSVVETGRFGASGYAIRGVDENRVGIAIDGLRQAETLASKGFKDLYEGYGNFNNTRNGIELENVKQATITKGSDSIKTGSGGLGGSVVFETKDARDYLIDKNYHFGFKNGYQSQNSQHMRSITTAARYGWFDILLINTYRNGHETKNYFYNIYKDKDEDYSSLGPTRKKADPYQISRKSNLVKFGFEPSDEHRFTLSFDDSKINSKGEDLSYLLRYGSDYSNAPVLKYGERKNHDRSHRRNLSYAYENYTQNPFWDSMKITFSNQKIKNTARTDDYCSGDKCQGVQNPQGLMLKEDNGVIRLADKTGGYITGEYDWGRTYKNSEGKKLRKLNGDYQEFGFDKTFIDCSKFDCSKKLSVYSDEENKFVDREIITKTMANGFKYGTFDEKELPKLYFITPPYGYESNDYNDRDLNTDTKQLNIDFEKEFSVFGIEHYLKYGGLYEKTKKSMINQDGYEYQNIKWWADIFFGHEEQYDLINYLKLYLPRPDRLPSANGLLRHKKGDIHTYLIPVETKTTAFYIGDNIQVFDWLGFDLGYRYDKVVHNPSYDENVPVPKGIVTGLFEKIDCNAYDNSSPYYCGYNSPKYEANFRTNLRHLLKKTEYKNDSYSLGLNLDPFEWMRLQLKYSNGFRAPTSDEIYMTFKHPSFTIVPNTKLKEELAKTKEIALTFYKEKSFLSFNLFKTDYKNFIDMEFMGERPVEIGSVLKYPFYQSVNRDSAQVKGFEINSKLNLAQISQNLDGFSMGYKFIHQKGVMEKTMPMNAIQPQTQVFSIGYQDPDDKFGVDFYLTHVAAKKAKDTYNMFYKDQMKNGKKVKGKEVSDSYVAYRNKAYTVLDMIAYVKPSKNFTLGFGLYNITNQKYVTWDSARSIRAIGANNLIDQNTGAGFERFYAPKRNFRLTWELTF